MAIRELLVDMLLDLIEDADEAQLEAAFRAIRGLKPSLQQPRHTTPPPGSGPRTLAPSERPGSTRELVRRAMQRAGQPVPLEVVTRLVRQEQPAVSKGSISGTLSKMTQEGEARRSGMPRAGRYGLVQSR